MDRHSEPPPDYEELEQIPWSSLAASTPDWRTRILPAAAVVAAAVVVGMLVVRMFTSASEATVVPLNGADSPAASVEFGAAAVDETTTSTVLPAVAAEGGSPGIYSEADLLAAPIDDETRLAVMRAEWFVTDYFTVDGDPETASGIRGALGSDEALPHDDPLATSYVEWARAFRVESARPGSYRVLVAFRVLVSADGGEFSRGAVEAVSVDLAVDADGAVAVFDLPSPAEIPLAAASVSRPASAEPPPEVVAAAFDAVAPMGGDPELVSAGLSGDGWRVVVSVADSVGLRWPVVVYPETGEG